MLAEPDVLRLIVNSTLPAAECFERWVFEEVLPSIRRTGRYESPAMAAPASLRTKLIAWWPPVARSTRSCAPRAPLASRCRRPSAAQRKARSAKPALTCWTKWPPPRAPEAMEERAATVAIRDPLGCACRDASAKTLASADEGRLVASRCGC